MSSQVSITKHTPTPWAISSNGFNIYGPPDAEGQVTFVASIFRKPIQDIEDANAEFIVRACNAHDELLAACKATLKYLQYSSKHAENRELRKQIRAAVDKAEGSDE